ncbi:hypothetical protein [Homoserinimonas sp. OAct 916]|uniref:hypothetical protein n=1 Tax=Homoserinimonas sp. OAct 916 TaxID=2211450 RepID=UPI0013003437|nr:hypothetical protein [Homoserinimonas sp. OAct 916]
MKRSAIAALVLAATVTILSACAGAPPTAEETPSIAMPSSVADRTYRGMPESNEPFSETPRIIWIERNKTFALTLFGSSSCPSIPTSITTDADNAITIHFEQSSNDPCTADMAATTYEFTVPSGSGATPLTVTLDYAPEGGTYPMILE